MKRPFVMIGNVQLDVGGIGINGVGINGTGICVFGFDPSVACKKASVAPDDALSPQKNKTLPLQQYSTVLINSTKQQA